MTRDELEMACYRPDDVPRVGDRLLGLLIAGLSGGLTGFGVGMLTAWVWWF